MNRVDPPKMNPAQRKIAEQRAISNLKTATKSLIGKLKKDGRIDDAQQDKLTEKLNGITELKELANFRSNLLIFDKNPDISIDTVLEGTA